MFIVWGRSSYRWRLGRVADYCPQCAEPRAMRVTQLRSYPHVYFIPLWLSRADFHLARCLSCRREYAFDPARFRSICRDRRATLEELADRTNPDLADQVAHRLDAIDRIRDGVADADERIAFMLEPVVLAACDIEKRKLKTHTDWWTGLAMTSFIPLPLLGAFIGDAIAPHADQGLFAGGFAGVVAALCLTCAAVVTDVRRFARRRIRTDLVPRLAELRPTLDDLERIAEHARGQRWTLAKHFRPAAVLDLLEERAIRPSSS